jgi:hypothetical protein
VVGFAECFWVGCLDGAWVGSAVGGRVSLVVGRTVGGVTAFTKMFATVARVGFGVLP